MRLLILTFVCAGLHFGALGQTLAGQLPDTLLVRVSAEGDIYMTIPVSQGIDRIDIANLFGCTPDQILESWGHTELEQAIYLVPLLHPISHDSSKIAGRTVQLIYRVKPKETLFTIARRYFGLKVPDLQKMNGLDSTALSIGQILHIGSIDLRPPIIIDHLPRAVDSTANIPLPDPFEGAEAIHVERGVALWNKNHPETQHLFVMHRTARINSVLEITNPMFGRKLLVKVVGQIPRTFSPDVMVVVSPGVARKLGAIDSRFYVHLRYTE